MSGLAYLGPIKVDFHGDPSFSWASKLEPDGTRDLNIGGLLERKVADQLSELLANPDVAPTTGGKAGVIVYLYAGADNLKAYNGWTLLEGVQIDADYLASLTGEVTISIDGCHLGNMREVSIPRSAFPKGDDLGLTAQSLVVAPLRPDATAGDRFLVDPGGAFATRSYDPTSTHDVGADTPPGGARSLGFYVGTVTDGTDELEDVAFPEVRTTSGGPPPWLVDQGDQVRAYDRAQGRDVFGPVHTFEDTTDLRVSNGLVSFWLGNVGLPPFLNVDAFDGTAWRPEGYVVLGDPTNTDVVLTAARLVRWTPDDAVVALRIRGQGEALVRLRRGERKLDVVHGSDLEPVTTNRYVGWTGLPPWSRLVSAGQGAARFGLGIRSENSGATWGDPVATWDDPVFSWGGSFPRPDFRLLWPPSVDERDWGIGWRFRTAQAADALDAGGQLTVGASSGPKPVRLFFDTATKRFKLTVGATTLQSSVQTFTAGTDLFLGAVLSPDKGLALVVKAGASPLELIEDPAAVSPGTTARYKELYLGVGSGAWGDPGSAWGDAGGVWGGLTFPDGVVSDLMVFRRRPADFEAIASATSRLGNLPDPEGLLAWLATFDPRPIPRGSVVAAGRRFEATAVRGSVRRPDLAGYTKAVAVLDSTVGGPFDFPMLAAHTDVLEATVYLATTAPHDDLVDHHQQFAAESTQELRVR